MKRFISLFFLLVLAFGGIGDALARELPNEIIPLKKEEIPASFPGQIHYLLACTDTWHGDASNPGNTDGILMLTLDTVKRRIMVTTFTREMLIKRPDGGFGRITYITKNYGPEALCEIVSTHFGVHVNKYVIFNMDDVQTIIDAVGGVDITVTDAEAAYLNRYRISRDSTTPSMNKAGTYLFSGHAAVIYMRIRKVGGDGDSGRTRRIRTVLSTLAKKFEEVTLEEAFNVLSSIQDNMLTTNLSFGDMFDAVSYAVALRDCTVEGIQMPPQDCLSPITYAGMETRQVDFARSREALWKFLEGEENYGVE